MQETYSTAEVEHRWKNEWGGQVFYSHGTPHSRGVMVLIRPGFDAKITNVERDNIGRFMLVEATIEDAPFKLINIYSPNNEEPQVHFYNYLKNMLTANCKSDDNILLGGDFNIPFDPYMDRKSEVPFHQSQKYRNIINTLNLIKIRLELQDAWRTKNPEKKRYTWSRAHPTKVKTRLDYWLSSEHIADYIEYVDIVPCIKSDHSAITMTLNSVDHDNRSVKSKGYWKLNTSYLEEETYIRGILEGKNKWIDDLKTCQDDIVKWEYIKYKIRDFSIQYGKNKANNLSREEADLEERLHTLQEQSDENGLQNNVEVEEESKRIRERLEEITNYRTEGLILRSQATWYEQGEKSNSYFLRLETRNRIKKSVNKLQKPDDTFTTDPTEILNMQMNFYKDLYSSKGTQTTAQINDYLTKVETPKLDEQDKLSCEGLLSLEECHKVIKTFKNKKSPGNDGLPIEFYKKFWPVFGQIVVDSFNKAYDTGEMSTSQRQAVITLLDKGKDRTLLKNWRPISLLNTDYKIASKAIAQRLTKYLHKIIHPNQAGYVKGRNISENIRTLLDILDYLKQTDKPGILINIDFKKAFDSIEWTFLREVLKKFNFGNSFIHWIEVFYKNISSCMINKGKTSQYFELKRGVRQGDPLSPYLFILVAEILASNIRQNKNITGVKINDTEIKCLQYADDTSGILKDIASAKAFLHTVEKFGTYSGLTLNKTKTEGMWLGTNRDNTSKPLGISWSDEPVRVLGVYISYNEQECIRKNFQDKIIKCKGILDMWKGRNLSIIGRIQIVRTFIISQFLYVSSSIDVPSFIIREVDKLIMDFIWRGKRSKIRKSILKSSVELGGLKVPDFASMIKTSKVQWLRRLASGTESAWKTFMEYHLQKLNIPLNILLHSNFDMKSAKLNRTHNNIPLFYLNLLQLWAEIGETKPIQKVNFLWYNRNIKVKNKSIFYKEFFKVGIWYIQDLYDEDGTLVPFETWTSRGLQGSNLIRWMGLVGKIQSMDRIFCDDATQLCVRLADKLTPLTELKSPVLYQYCIEREFEDKVIEPRVNKYVQLPNNTTWKDIYTRVHSTSLNVKLKDFQYRFLHDALANGYWLYKWKIRDTDTCTLCGEVDNIRHVYWNCETTQQFWISFRNWWVEKQGEIEIDVNDVFYGTDNELLCHLIFAAKRHIYVQRISDKPPNINAYNEMVEHIKTLELYIARKNNKYGDWLEKWIFM